MTIIVTNLLVGLAVDDIKVVQEYAVLKRQALRIKLSLESFYNKLLSRPQRRANIFATLENNTLREVINKETIKVTLRDLTEKASKWIDPEGHITANKIRNLQHDQNQSETAEIWQSMEALRMVKIC